MWLGIYYESSNKLDDLERAIRYAEEARRLPTTNLASKQRLLHDLGWQLKRRYLRLYQRDDLENAIQCYQEAARVCPLHGSVKISLLEDLSAAYMLRFTITHDDDDRNMSQSLMDEAHQTHVVNAVSFLNAAINCLALYRITKNVEYLKEGAEKIDKSLSLSDGLPARVMGKILDSAGNIFRELYNCELSPEHSSSALGHFLACWEISGLVPVRRIVAARQAADMLCDAGRYLEAWNLLRKAVDLIPAACPRILRQADQQFVIKQLANLSSDACCAALAAGAEPAEALQILEQGRGIIIQFADGAVAELIELEAKAPQLFRKFELYRKQINSDQDSSDSVFDASDISEPSAPLSREAAIQALEGVIEEIRHQVRGFQNFLLPPTKEYFQRLATEGPIIVLTASNFRCDALIVIGKEFRAVSLTEPPGFPSLKHVSELFRDICIKGSSRTAPRQNSVLRGMLDCLWKFVGDPICKALDIGPLSTSAPFRRVWWIPTGYFSSLPIHAAGQDIGDCTNTMPRRVFSSYAASFRMLDFARSRAKEIGTRGLTGLMATMPWTSRG